MTQIVLSKGNVDFSKPEVLEILTDFLFRCKIEAWAGGTKYANSETFKGLKTFSTRARYVEGRPLYPDLEFRDEYQGHYNFAGRELVLNDGVPIWQMNYFGSTKLAPNSKYSAEEQAFRAEINERVFDDLRKAVSHMHRDLPLRGPEEYPRSQYTCRVEGDITNFSGIENIKRSVGKGEIKIEGIVYTLHFHGGILIPR